MKYFLPFLLTMTLFAQEPYRIGNGVSLVESQSVELNLGAHVNTLYTLADDADDTLAVTQAGVMAYGTVGGQLRFLGEVGAEDLFAYRFDDGKSTDNPVILNRLYAEYGVHEAFSVKAGQFLTPIGIFNPTYIGALRWTSVTPFVAQGFFPKVIAGVNVGGSFGEALNYEYDLFYHVGGETDRNPNAVKASEFVGAELRYVFGMDGRIAVPLGRFRSDSSKEICYIAGLNFLFPIGQAQLSGELLYKDGTWNESHWKAPRNWEELAWYLQLVQPIVGDHFATVRYGENKRSQTGWYNERNAVAGYVYRPWHALSFKAEYRYHGHQTVTTRRHSHSGNFSVGILF